MFEALKRYWKLIALIPLLILFILLFTAGTNQVLFISLIIIAYLGTLSKGRSYFIRWLKYFFLEVLLICGSSFFLLYLAVFYPQGMNIYIITLVFAVLFILAVHTIHKYYTGKGGSFYKEKVQK